MRIKSQGDARERRMCTSCLRARPISSIEMEADKEEAIAECDEEEGAEEDART